MKKLSGFVVCFLIFASAPIFAAEMNQVFHQANQLYANGKFKEAAEAYEKVNQQHPTAEIYYNLGNAYFKNKQLGLSILNYERAKRLSPRDRDVRTNLFYVNQLIEYKIEDKRNWYLQKKSQILSYFTFPELWFLFLSAYLLFISTLLGFLFRKKRLVFETLTVTLLSLGIVCAFPLILKYAESSVNAEAIVTARQAEVRYGPSTVDRIAFRLVEGLKVSVHDHKKDWYRVQIPDGRTGWTAEANIQTI